MACVQHNVVQLHAHALPGAIAGVATERNGAKMVNVPHHARTAAGNAQTGATHGLVIRHGVEMGVVQMNVLPAVHPGATPGHVKVRSGAMKVHVLLRVPHVLEWRKAWWHR